MHSVGVMLIDYVVFLSCSVVLVSESYIVCWLGNVSDSNNLCGVIGSV